MGGSTLLGQLITWPFLKTKVKLIKPKWSEVVVHFKPIFIYSLSLISMLPK